MKKKFYFIMIFLFSFLRAYSTTWNEPWAEKIIKESDYFILADILSFNEEKGVKLKIIKQIAGEKLPKEIEITNFYMLDIMSSSSGHGVEFNFDKIKSSYFFIKKNTENQYCIATPTSGFDYIMNENVAANYRHSYHRSLVPREVYELTMTAIFNKYHNINYDTTKISEFVRMQLLKKPSGFKEEEINTFFLQHVALETIFHLRIGDFFEKILPFLNDTSNFHNRVSAARALIAYNTVRSKQVLLNKIATNKEDDFTTVICIWTLADFRPVELKNELQELVHSASDQENGFGGNIMDPRVGTDFPEVKIALEDLIKKL